MPTARTYARRNAMDHPRASARNKLRPLKVRFSSRKFKKLVDETVRPLPVDLIKPASLAARPVADAKPVIVKPAQDPKRKEAMVELKKSLEQFEKLHREICSLCYSDRLEGGTSGNSQPDESSCPGEEASESGTEQDDETGNSNKGQKEGRTEEKDKEVLTSGSEKCSSQGSGRQRKSDAKRNKTPAHKGKCHPKCQCQTFMSPGPYIESKPKGPKVKTGGRTVTTAPSAPPVLMKAKPGKNQVSICTGATKGSDEPVKSSDKEPVCTVKETSTTTEQKENCTNTIEDTDAECSTEAKYKQKLCERQPPRDNCQFKREDDDWQQCQGFLCQMLYCLFRYVLIFPRKEALHRATQCMGRDSPRSPTP